VVEYNWASALGTLGPFLCGVMIPTNANTWPNKIGNSKNRPAVLEHFKKAAGLSEGPMSLGDLDILAASMELLALTLANMPKSMREIRLRAMPAILAADVAQKRKRIEEKIPKGSA